MNAFTIKDIENLTGIKAHTIRIWEQRYDFLKPQRTGTNIRYYGNEALKTILNIALLNKNGFKISHINKMTAGEINSNLIFLSGHQAMQERIINELVGYMADFDNCQFEDCLNVIIKSKGIDFLINRIIFPFLNRVGILWVTNHINPAQEHLVTNIIRQKILIGIENIKASYTSGNSVLLFLPEGEHHEVGLLYVQYMLKLKQIRVLYLGADVPLKDLEYVVNVKNPVFIYTHLTALSPGFNMEKFLLNVQKYAGNIPFYVSGSVTMSYKKDLPGNIIFKKSLEEVHSFIEDYKMNEG